MYQFSRYPENLDGTRMPGIMEVEHHVTQFKAYYPSGPTSDGGWRYDDLIQFYTDPGGLRTVRAEDIVIP